MKYAEYWDRCRRLKKRKELEAAAAPAVALDV